MFTLCSCAQVVNQPARETCKPAPQHRCAARDGSPRLPGLVSVILYLAYLCWFSVCVLHCDMYCECQFLLCEAHSCVHINLFGFVGSCYQVCRSAVVLLDRVIEYVEGLGGLQCSEILTIFVTTYRKVFACRLAGLFFSLGTSLISSGQSVSFIRITANTGALVGSGIRCRKAVRTVCRVLWAKRINVRFYPLESTFLMALQSIFYPTHLYKGYPPCIGEITLQQTGKGKFRLTAPA